MLEVSFGKPRFRAPFNAVLEWTEPNRGQLRLLQILRSRSGKPNHKSRADLRVRLRKRGVFVNSECSKELAILTNLGVFFFL